MVLHTIRRVITPPDHPYFVGIQYHPEYLTRPMHPSPPYLGLLLASCSKLTGFLSRGCQLSPRASFDYGSEDEADDEVTQAFSKMSTSPFPLSSEASPQHAN